MSDFNFDELAKLSAKSVSRRQSLRGIAAALGGALLASVGASNAFAAAPPQICVICACGVGRPCNVKQQLCGTTRGFPSPEQACVQACEQRGFKFCGGVTQFHCPQGLANCPAGTT